MPYTTDPITGQQVWAGATLPAQTVSSVTSLLTSFGSRLTAVEEGAITLNGLTITATTATLTLANGKALTVSNTMTLAGTDGTTMTFPSTSGTVVTLAAIQTLTNKTLTNATINTPAINTPAITGGTMSDADISSCDLTDIALMGATYIGMQALSGAGALTAISVAITGTSIATVAGAATSTLANGTSQGQLKFITMITDGGDMVITVANLQGGTTLTFNDAGDSVLLLFAGTKWIIISNIGCTVS